MDPENRLRLEITRRQFFGRTSTGIGTAALASILNPHLFSGRTDKAFPPGTRTGLPHFAPKAKRVIFLFQSGAPAQMDLFDYKPQLEKHRGTDLPDSVRRGQRITGMTSRQKTLPVAPSIFKFGRYGESGARVSELLPRTAQIVDDIAIVKTLHTEAINHDPGITFFQTGSQQPGRPSLGAWLSYGLGSESRDLPSFVVMVSIGRVKTNPQPIFSRLWGAGFLPSDHQGVKLRGVGDPVLYLSNPPGVDHRSRRRMLDGIGQLNRLRAETFGDPEITTRISQYEMAYKMQLSVPELTDVSNEPDPIFELYGPDSRKPGTYAANCLMARRLSEAGVRFVQLYHRGWDQHNDLPAQIRGQCEDTDQASAALVTDLKQRGLLDETLVIWGGRVRANRLLPGPAHRGQLRARPPSTLFHHVDGRRRHPSRDQLRRDRRLQLQRGEGPGPRPRFPGDGPPLPGNRPLPAYLQVPGTPLPAHRHPRRCVEAAAGVIRTPRERKLGLGK